MIYAGFPSFFGFGIRGRLHSNVLASTVGFAGPLRGGRSGGYAEKSINSPCYSTRSQDKGFEMERLRERCRCTYIPSMHA